nr:helix-turn-helix transcriptional regulator [Actinopolyspora halophila]
MRAIARIDQLRQRCDAAGWTPTELSRHMGMSQSAISRVLRGQAQPGEKFIAAALVTFGADFTDLFEIDPAEEVPA